MPTTQQITNLAIDKVRDNNIKQYNDILDFATTWVKTKYYPFTSEELKEAYFIHTKKETTEKRVYGAIFRELARLKLIYSTGEYVKSKNPVCHSRPQLKWISHEYRLMQQKKATKEQSLKIEFVN
jgi:hypothetical protein